MELSTTIQLRTTGYFQSWPIQFLINTRSVVDNGTDISNFMSHKITIEKILSPNTLGNGIRIFRILFGGCSAAGDGDWINFTRPHLKWIVLSA